MLNSTSKAKAGERDHILAAVALLIPHAKVIICLVSKEAKAGDLGSVHHPRRWFSEAEQRWLWNQQASGEEGPLPTPQEPRSSTRAAGAPPSSTVPTALSSSESSLQPQKPWLTLDQQALLL